MRFAAHEYSHMDVVDVYDSDENDRVQKVDTFRLDEATNSKNSKYI